MYVCIDISYHLQKVKAEYITGLLRTMSVGNSGKLSCKYTVNIVYQIATLCSWGKWQLAANLKTKFELHHQLETEICMYININQRPRAQKYQPCFQGKAKAKLNFSKSIYFPETIQQSFRFKLTGVETKDVTLYRPRPHRFLQKQPRAQGNQSESTTLPW